MTSTLETAFWLAVIGMVGIFVFMVLFFLLIVGLDKLFPHTEAPKENNEDLMTEG